MNEIIEAKQVKTIPMYKQIENDLRKAILNGDLKQGDMTPSETVLAAKYKTTRMTVRQAINNLLIDGYIYRHKGRGTFVIFNKKEMDNPTPYFSFHREMIGINSEITTQVLKFDIIEADDIIAKRLQLKVGDKVYYVERFRQSDNIPLLHERLYLPINMYPTLNEEIFKGSFHDYVQNELGFEIRNCESALEARAINNNLSDLFQQSIGEPTLYMSSTTYLENGRAFMYTRQYFNANHFRFRHNFEKR